MVQMAFGVRNLALSTITGLQQRHELKVRSGKPGFSYSLYRVASRKQVAATTPTNLSAFPALKLESDILVTHTLTSSVMDMLPPRLQLQHPLRIFSAKQDGTSFTRLWQKIDAAEQSLILIGTFDGAVFGAFAAGSWRDRLSKGRNLFFGSGESFLFRLKPSPAEKYGWVGTDKDRTGHNEDLFQAADATSLIVGGGGAEGLSIREELVCGMTDHCDTFDNPPLTPTKAFEIKDFEVFTFMDESQLQTEE